MVDIVLPGTADITKAFWWHLDDRWDMSFGEQLERRADKSLTLELFCWTWDASVASAQMIEDTWETAMLQRCWIFARCSECQSHTLNLGLQHHVFKANMFWHPTISNSGFIIQSSFLSWERNTSSRSISELLKIVHQPQLSETPCQIDRHKMIRKDLWESVQKK